MEPIVSQDRCDGAPALTDAITTAGLNPEMAAVPASSLITRYSSLFLNPYLQLAMNGFLVTASEILLKRGAMATAQVSAPPWLMRLGFVTLGSWWTWAGIAIYIVSFFNWLYVLRRVPLSIAFPLASVVHVLIPLGSWAFLGEHISPIRWGGILLILFGIALIARSVGDAEEAL
jgi:drug/metabolite transporter (DMT)-like permease